MSAIRKIVMLAATLFLGLSGIFMATGTAAADQPLAVQSDNDWHAPSA